MCIRSLYSWLICGFFLLIGLQSVLAQDVTFFPKYQASYSNAIHPIWGVQKMQIQAVLSNQNVNLPIFLASSKFASEKTTQLAIGYIKPLHSTCSLAVYGGVNVEQTPEWQNYKPYLATGIWIQKNCIQYRMLTSLYPKLESKHQVRYGFEFFPFVFRSALAWNLDTQGFVQAGFEWDLLRQFSVGIEASNRQSVSILTRFHSKKWYAEVIQSCLTANFHTTQVEIVWPF